MCPHPDPAVWQPVGPLPLTLLHAARHFCRARILIVQEHEVKLRCVAVAEVEHNIALLKPGLRFSEFQQQAF